MQQGVDGCENRAEPDMRALASPPSGHCHPGVSSQGVRPAAAAPTSLTIADTAPGPERENGMTRDVASAECADMPRLLPTKVGRNHAGASPGVRAIDPADLARLVQAADGLGHETVPIPAGRSCEDGGRVAVGARLQPPTLLVLMTTTLDRMSDGQALLA
jgi:hypothetical protein